MLIRSMLYHRKPLFWIFMAFTALAIVAGVWLLARAPVENADTSATPAPTPRDSHRDKEASEPGAITLELYQGGESVHGLTIKEACAETDRDRRRIRLLDQVRRVTRHRYR